MNDDAIISRTEKWLDAQLDDETLIMDAETGSMFSLSQSGQAVWNLLEEPMSFARLRQAMSERYDVDPAQCRSEIEAFVEEMSANNLFAVTD